VPVVGKQRDADARADVEHVAIDGIGSADQVDQAYGHSLRGFRLVCAGLYDDKLVPAEAGDQVSLTQGALEAIGDLEQQGIPDGVARASR
jgi:hypothetical protein